MKCILYVIKGQTMLRIAIGSDHRGFEHKAVIQHAVTHDEKRIEWLDVGCFTPERCDYPPFAHVVVQEIKARKADLGILLCGTGVGMAIAANRFNHIYAALVWDKITAQRSKEEDNANILVLPADYMSPQESAELVSIWLNAQFLENRYEKRLNIIDSWGGL